MNKEKLNSWPRWSLSINLTSDQLLSSCQRVSGLHNVTPSDVSTRPKQRWAEFVKDKGHHLLLIIDRLLNVQVESAASIRDSAVKLQPDSRLVESLWWAAAKVLVLSWSQRWSVNVWQKEEVSLWSAWIVRLTDNHWIHPISMMFITVVLKEREKSLKRSSLFKWTSTWLKTQKSVFADSGPPVGPGLRLHPYYHIWHHCRYSYPWRPLQKSNESVIWM